jgi:hypothetical protein
VTLNNVIAVGDDQKWKAEVERQLKELQTAVTILNNQLNARSR